MKITNEDLMQEIYDLKKLIYDTYLVEQDIKVKEDEIKTETEDIGKKQDFIVKGLTILRYVNIQAWKKMIWDHCSAKLRDDDSGKVFYGCKITNSSCRFESCPKNISKK